MAGINLDKMKLRRDTLDDDSDSKFYKVQDGDTKLLQCPAPRPDDDEPYIEVWCHEKIAPDGKKGFAVCLDLDRNKCLTSPHLEPYLTRKVKGSEDEEYTIDVTEGCPVCERLASGELKDPKNARAVKLRWLLAWVPISHRPIGAKFDGWNDIGPKVVVMLARKQVGAGLIEVFMNNGDITDWDEAVYVIVTKKLDKKKQMPEYTVQADGKTQAKKVKVSPELRKIIKEAMRPNGPADLYKWLGILLKDRTKIERMMDGEVDTEEVESDESDSAGGKRETLAERLRRSKAEKEARRQAASGSTEEPAEDEAPPEEEQEVETPKAAAKPAQTTKPTAPKATTATPAKAAPKLSPAKQKVLAKFPDMTDEERGRLTTCFANQCDLDDTKCRGCRLKHDCAPLAGLEEVPPDLEEVQEEEAPPFDLDTPPAEMTIIAAKDCVEGLVYVMPSGKEGTFLGVKANAAYFEVEGKQMKLPLDAEVEGQMGEDDPEVAVEQEEAPAEDEDDEALAAAAAAAAKAAAAKQKASAPARKKG